VTPFGPSHSYVDREVPADEIARARKRARFAGFQSRATPGTTQELCCATCGSAYRVQASIAPTSRFCSRPCANVGKRTGRPSARRVTAADVIAIRRRCDAGEFQNVVAKAFGVSPTTVSKIVGGKSWKAVGL